MALLAACINYWLSKEEQSPHVFVSTHIYGVTQWLLRNKQLKCQVSQIDYCHLVDRLQKKSSQFQSHVLNNLSSVREMLDVSQEEDDLVYLYQLKDGEASCSFASHVARQAGLREDIIKRAAEVS